MSEWQKASAAQRRKQRKASRQRRGRYPLWATRQTGAGVGEGCGECEADDDGITLDDGRVALDDDSGARLEIERALEEDGNALEEDGATLDEDGAALLGVGRGGEEDGAALLDEDRQRPSHEGDSHLPCGSGTQNCPMAERKGTAAVKYTRPRNTRHAAC